MTPLLTDPEAAATGCHSCLVPLLYKSVPGLGMQVTCLERRLHAQYNNSIDGIAARILLHYEALPGYTQSQGLAMKRP
jgi:hypothetical protein